MKNCTCSFVCASLLGPVALVLLSLAFGTNHWEDHRVNRDNLPSTQRGRSTVNINMGRYYHTREVGLFLECYPGSDNEFLDFSPDKVDGICFKVDYDIPTYMENPSSEYTVYMNIHRCVPAFFGAGIFMFLLAYIFGIVRCFLRTPRYAYTASICAFVAAFFVIVAMAMFHGAYYISRNELTSQSELQFYSRWPEELKAATTSTLGWSYIVAWIGMAAAIVCGILYAVTACYTHTEDDDDDDDDYNDKRVISQKMHTMEPRTNYAYPFYFGSDDHYDFRHSLRRPATPQSLTYALTPPQMHSSLPALGYYEHPRRNDIYRMSREL